MKAGQKYILSTHVLNDGFWICLTKNKVKKPMVDPTVLFLFKIYNFQNSNCFKLFKASAHSKNKSSEFELPTTVHTHSTIFFSLFSKQ